MAANSETVRLNLRITPDVKARLEELKDETNSANLAEVVRRALTLYDAMYSESKDGSKVILRDSEGKDREVMLIF